MSVPMRKHPTRSIVFHIVYKGDQYDIPKSVAMKYKVSDDETSVLADDFFAELDRQYTKPGVLLRGIRVRENLSQIEFAEKIGVTQSDLSKMELGKRPIGKIIAKRIEEMFDVNYRLLLG